MEFLVACLGVWFGGGIYFVLTMGIGDPLWWAGLSPEEQLMLASVILTGGVISALGTRLNGGWQYSPLLRAAGLMMHAGALWFLTFSIAGNPDSVHGVPSGFFTYSGLAVAITWTAYMAALDVVKMRRIRRHG